MSTAQLEVRRPYLIFATVEAEAMNDIESREPHRLWGVTLIFRNETDSVSSSFQQLQVGICSSGSCCVSTPSETPFTRESSIFGTAIVLGEKDMRRTVLLAGLLLTASSAMSNVYAQNQPAGSPVGPNQSIPVGSAKENQQGAGSSPELTADYPTDRAGVLIQGATWTVVTNQMPTKLKSAHGIAASLSYGMVPVKIVAEYDGEDASTRIEADRPILCLCHISSIPGAPVIVRLHPKKGARELDGGRMIAYPLVGNTKMADANKSDLISADISRPDPQVWLIRPQSSLEPGQYALMLGTQNVSIYPFTIMAPSVHPSSSN